MQAFFHGWRRKTGCLLLAFAVATMALWFRSYVVIDEISFGEQSLETVGGDIDWTRISDESQIHSTIGLKLRWNTYRPGVGIYSLPYEDAWRYQFPGLEFSKSTWDLENIRDKSTMTYTKRSW